MTSGLDGSSQRTIASGQCFPLGIAVDASGVYWINNGDGTVMRATLSDGGTVATLASGQGNPQSLVVRGGIVYFSTDDSATTAFYIRTVPTGGGTLGTLLMDVSEGWGLAVDSTSVYWQEGGDILDLVVRKMLLDGGALTTIASGQGGDVGLAVDSTSLYWANDRTNGVMRIDIDGGTPITLAPATTPLGVAVDSTNVYYAQGHTVMAVPIGGGAPIAIATGQYPTQFAVDSTYVYWTDAGSCPADGGTCTGSVLKIAKP